MYEVEVVTPVALRLSTESANTMLDTVLYVRSDCNANLSELGCDDDSGANGSSILFLPRVEPGTYYVIVDSHDIGTAGHFELKTEQFVPRGESCTEETNCAPDLSCRKLIPAAAGTTCEPPVCSDGADNDNDSIIDFPLEPGCQSADDTDETDSCPGNGCPECADGDDNDEDGFTDYPADPACLSANGALELECEDSSPIVEITSATTTGNNTSSGDDFTPSCSFGSAGNDSVFVLRVDSPLKNLVVDSLGTTFSHYLSVKAGECTALELACSSSFSTGTSISLNDLAAGFYFIMVDGSFAATGNFTLHVNGTIAKGGKCDPAQTNFVCEEGSLCQGPAGEKTCKATQCNNNNDNDDDGKVDYPNDPGCTSVSDNNEEDNCPNGPNCPQCADGVDNDNDGDTDFPDETGCVSASSPKELSCDNNIKDQDETGVDCGGSCESCGPCTDVEQGTCSHPLCMTGAKLVSGCDNEQGCVALICATDSFCCNSSWDGACVNEVSSVCGL